MQVELFLDESCLTSCELLMIETKKNLASYCFKEIAYNRKIGVSHTTDKRNLLYLPDSIETTYLEELTLWCPSGLKVPNKPVSNRVKDLRGWQFLRMKAVETLCILCLPPEEHIS